MEQPGGLSLSQTQVLNRVGRLLLKQTEPAGMARLFEEAVAPFLSCDRLSILERSADPIDRLAYLGWLHSPAHFGEPAGRELSELGPLGARLREQGFRAAVVLPLRGKQGPVGAVEILSRAPIDLEGGRLLEFLDHLSDPLAHAIESHQIQGELRRRRLQSERLTEIATAASSSLDLAEVVARMGGILAEIAPIRRISVREIEGETLVRVAEWGGAASSPLIVPLEGAFRRFIDEGRSIADLASAAGLLSPAWFASHGAGCALAVPLFAELRVFGVVVFGGAAPGGFTAEERSLLEGVAQRLAPAAANARTHRRLESTKAQLDELVAARESLTGLLLHDLKSPLSIVKANLDFLARQKGHLAGDDLDALSDATQGSERALQLVVQLLDIARMEEAQLGLHRESVDLAALCAGVAHGFAITLREPGCTVEVRAEPGLSASLDAGLLQRVLENLVSNAARFVPRGRGAIELSARQLDGAIEIAVEDNGPGVPEELRERVCQKYGQGEAAGIYNRGLGLYFCKLVAEAHRGELRVDSSPRFSGARFALTLPTLGPGVP